VTEPVYRRIAQDLRDKIESGEVAPGSQLPSELELKDRYGASRNTIRDAVRWLIRRGLVETRPGQGTFAARRFEPFVTTLSADPQTGLGGGEGDGALAEVRERGHTPSASPPRIEVLFANSAIAARNIIQASRRASCGALHVTTNIAARRRRSSQWATSCVRVATKISQCIHREATCIRWAPKRSA